MVKFISEFLQMYIDPTNKLTRKIYDAFLDFGYFDKELFMIDLLYLLKIYDINIYEEKTIRSEQDVFRDKIVNRDKCCVISSVDEIECESAHIIPLNVETNYDIDNGILLSSSLHKMFDKYMWTINPTTLKIEISKKILNKNSICNQYDDQHIKFIPSDKMIENLKYRYGLFIDANGSCLIKN